MGRPCRLLCLAYTCLVMHVLWWRLCRSQVPGFLSIDCGSDATTVYTDDNGIEWVGDSDLITEGTSLVLTQTDIRNVMNTMRLFNGSHSKYCYSLTNSAIKRGATFMVRASFWTGNGLPYTPQSKDGRFRFTLIVDADVWEQDVALAHNSSTWYFNDIYVIAQRNSMDVCFARSSPGGDAPFVSALELRPLPPTLLSTELMLNSSRYYLPVFAGHIDYGVPSSNMSTQTRYPRDPLDRIWTSFEASPPNLQETNSTINTEDDQNMLPINILQNSFTSTSIINTYTNLALNREYFAELFFAEIDPIVNASGQRVFDLLVNGVLKTSSRPIDVFDFVKSNAAYGYGVVFQPDGNGFVNFTLTPIPSSIYQPCIAASTFFYTWTFSHITDATTISAITDVKASLNLNSSQGDPCFPFRYGYEWLTCTVDPNVTSISLSNYSTGGVIPAALNSLTLLTEIHLDGNGLQGEIPDLSALTNLQTLVLSNNELTGSIPEYLGTLTNLKVLDLQNNKLSGAIPAKLLERKQASTLAFEFSGNLLCDTNTSGLTCMPPSPTPSTPFLNTPSLSTPKKKSISGITIGVAVAVVLLVGIGTAIAVYFLCKKNPSSTLEQPINRHHNSPMQELPRVYSTSGSAISKAVSKVSVQEFSFNEIKVATNNFSTQVGRGGFGPVYKGRLEDGCSVAIKVASNTSHQGSKEFLNEVDLLSRVHHKNLVGLLGYCNNEKLVLVYEFMSNGSLSDCLHGPYAKASPLPWGTRLRIMVDAAQGFDYLHHGCNPRIIHRDVKSSNVLLNDQLEAKISDFGISRNSFVNISGAPSTALMGSVGYMDPEYIFSMKLTKKVDVYSFGVLLFEVVCGKTAVFTNSSLQQTSIMEWAKPSIDRGMIDEIIDPLLYQQYNTSSVWKVLETALACVSFPSAKRPTMNVVLLELKEAERMELESGQTNIFDTPSTDFIVADDFNILSYTHVGVR